MAKTAKPFCNAEHPDEEPAEVPIGARYCWSCQEKTEVGKFLVRDGQLLWKTTGDVKPPVQVAFAVLCRDKENHDEQVELDDGDIKVSDLGQLTLSVAKKSATVTIKSLMEGATEEHPLEFVVVSVA